MEQQQRLAGDTATDIALANRGQRLASCGVGQRHVQLPHFQEVDVGNRQLDEHAEHAGQQRCRAPHGDVDHFAEGITKTDRFAVAATDQRRQVVQQAEAGQGLMQMDGIGGFPDEGQRPQFEHPAYRFILNVGGDHDGLAAQALLAQLCEYLIAVELGHGEIEQQDLDAALAYAL